MTTTPEAIATIIGRLRACTAGEPMPDHGTPEQEALTAAVSTLVSNAGEHDLRSLGAASLQVMLDAMAAHIGAQRAAVVAQLAAVRGEGGHA